MKHTFSVLAYQESPYLEKCLKSVTNQSYPSKVVIVTTTNNKYIRNLAKKYKVPVKVGKHTNIGGDFDLAKNMADTELVTIAHQDDIYDRDYAKNIIEQYQKHPNSSIIFTDYYEIRNNKKVYTNTNLKIKRILLTPIKLTKNAKSKLLKRSALKFGNAICCPSVTFIRKNCPKRVFDSKMKCNIDWHAWEKLSRQPHSFTYITKPLMGHRISEDSTTTDIINQGIRTKEDYEIFKRFWPKLVAKLLTKFYRNSEKSNKV